MQLAESNPEISFEVIEKELQIKLAEVECFIIEGTLLNILLTNIKYSRNKIIQDRFSSVNRLYFA